MLGAASTLDRRDSRAFRAVKTLWKSRLPASVQCSSR